MDFTESAELALVRESVRRIGAGFGHRYWSEKARTGGRLDELWRALGEGGFLGANLPPAFGGGGLGIAATAIVCEELAAAGCPLLLMVVSPSICGTILARFGTEAQQEAWLPDIASGRRKMAFALTEPDAGSNTHNVATTAARDGSGWRLRGSKIYISFADEADAILVVARTATDERTGRARLSLFVVPADAPGLRKDLIPVEIVAPDRQFLLFFDDVALPEDALVGRPGEGLRQLFHGLNPERITGAAMAVGTGLYALARACDYARQRKVWDVPIGAHQGLAHPLAQAKIDLELARLMTQKAAWLHDTGQEAGEAANMAKFAAAEAAL
ncbi:MAG TPA: acyl-CoA dehydrogenase, partial [Vicinamibacteria bacterium]|nr:acyl-CoA dehydrogenase [Vicinamibacteria bacterium]